MSTNDGIDSDILGLSSIVLPILISALLITSFSALTVAETQVHKPSSTEPSNELVNADAQSVRTAAASNTTVTFTITVENPSDVAGRMKIGARQDPSDHVPANWSAWIVSENETTPVELDYEPSPEIWSTVKSVGANESLKFSVTYEVSGDDVYKFEGAARANDAQTTVYDSVTVGDPSAGDDSESDDDQTSDDDGSSDPAPDTPFKVNFTISVDNPTDSADTVDIAPRQAPSEDVPASWSASIVSGDSSTPEELDYAPAPEVWRTTSALGPDETLQFHVTYAVPENRSYTFVAAVRVNDEVVTVSDQSHPADDGEQGINDGDQSGDNGFDSNPSPPTITYSFTIPNPTDSADTVRLAPAVKPSPLSETPQNWSATIVRADGAVPVNLSYQTSPRVWRTETELGPNETLTFNVTYGVWANGTHQFVVAAHVNQEINKYDDAVTVDNVSVNPADRPDDGQDGTGDDQGDDQNEEDSSNDDEEDSSKDEPSAATRANFSITVENPSDSAGSVEIAPREDPSEDVPADWAARFRSENETKSVELDYWPSPEVWSTSSALGPNESLTFNVSYAVAGPGTYTVEMAVRVNGVITTISDSVTIESSDNSGSSSLTLSAENVTVYANSSATAEVPFNVTATESVSNAGFQLSDYPDNWVVFSLSADDGDCSPKACFWISGLDAEQSVTATVVFEIPNASVPGTYTVQGSASTDETKTTETTTITVKPKASDSDENGSNESQSPPSTPATPVEAIAGSDNQVEFTEVLEAIQLFNDGNEVPGTDGGTLEFSDILELIQAFNSDTPVGQSG